MPDTSLSFPIAGRQRLTTFAFCSGLGGQTKGFQKARIRLGGLTAQWECIGAVDSDPAAIRDFERLMGAAGLRAGRQGLAGAE